ncbi:MULTISPECIES: PP2C family protein-serine/threonine phosphatase [unclassified Paenibacillus]|uniref:PP2C family protein-serine/threonine phosphatase n=1 Tax=unclassified Paenibacillus TaxID=185978 RepID=UPI0030FBCD72
MGMEKWFTSDVLAVYAAVFVVVAILIVVRQRLRAAVTAGPSRKAAPSPELASSEQQPDREISLGNAQTIGRRTEQDDYFASAVTKVGTLAVTMFSREFLKLDDAGDIPEFFHKASIVSNRAIMEQLGGAIGGTTLVAAVISDHRLHWGAVGDSLILLFRDGEFLPVNSKDTFESVLEARYLAGEIGREEVSGNPMKNQLTNYLGYGGFMSMEVGEPIPLEPGDIVILCSDGVYDALTEVEMEEILMQRMPPQETAEEMIACVERKSYKHQDNATVLILEH